MKKLYLFALAAAMALFSACSSDDIEATKNVVSEKSSSYITVSINTPTVSTSRAANDNYDSGLDREYFIKDANLLVFVGTTEETATFTKEFNILKQVISATDNSSLSNPQVTIELQFAAQDADAINDNANQVYALVIVNKPTDFSVTDDATIQQTIQQTINCDKLVDSEGNIMMLSALLANKPGGTADPSGATTSMAVNIKDKIKASPSEANSDPAIFYVERAAAKIDVSSGTSFTTDANGTHVDYSLKIDGTDYEYIACLDGWVLANVNPKSYLGHNWNNAWTTYLSSYVTPSNYRFIGNTAVSTNSYRTYWGTCPNYGTNLTGAKKFQTKAADPYPVSNPTFMAVGAANYLYCPENTFPVDKMTVKNATHVIIKTIYKLKSSGATQNFYTLNNDRSKVYTKTAIEQEIKNALTILYPTQLPTSEHSNITIVYEEESAGVNRISKIKLSGTEQTYVDIKNLNINNKIIKYADGVAYYKVPIKHFGDDLTPWAASQAEVSPGDEVDNAYGSVEATRNNNYLGRYGMLRNNWYSVELNGITGIGDATIPDIPGDDTPLDCVHTYISAKINILSWAKRTQSVTLQ